MKNKSRIVLVGILALLAVIIVPSALAAQGDFYLDPQHSTGSAGNDTYVLVKIETTTDMRGYQTDIYFDPVIVNITNVDFSDSTWGGGTASWTWYSNHVTFAEMGATKSAGTYTLANLTLRGIGAGTSHLNFGGTLLSDSVGEPLTTSTENGTYTAAPTAQGEFYLDPQHSTGSVGSDTNVLVKIGTTTDMKGYQTDIYFNPAILNITNVDFSDSPWGGGTASWTWYSNHVTFAEMGTTKSTGTYTLANLTLRGIGADTSHLNFGGTLLSDPSGDSLTTSTENGTYTAAFPPSIVINEFVSKPGITQTSEWIELYNPTGGDVSLDGWTVEDGAGNSLADLSGEIVPANDYLVFNFSNKLNDGGDIIYLNTSTTTVDRVTYGNWDDGNKDDNAPKPGIDNSTGRYPDGRDTDVDAEDFIEFDTLTPGAPNVISKVVVSIGTVIGNAVAPIRIDNASNVGAVDITVTYNSSVCVITDVTNGSFDVTLANLEHNHEGSVRIGVFQTENPGLNGSIILGNLTFRSNCTNGTSSLNLSVNTLTDATQECNDIPYIVKNGTFIAFLFLNGDVNGDGEVTLFDAMYLAKHVLDITGFEEIVEEAADVNGNDEIEISDAMYLAKHVLSITGFEELR